MQAATTITTTRQEAQVINATNPHIVLGGLIDSAASPCNCGQVVQQNQQAQVEVNEEIKHIQGEIRQIRSEVVEVERLLSVRDSLYQELDALRQERQQIEGEIQTFNAVGHSQSTTVVGYGQMNQRLRRRIYEIRQYIQKMTYQNQRIEEGIASQQFLNHQEDYLHRQKDIGSPHSYEARRYNMTGFQAMVTRLHEKQDDAWRRVRRQEEDIERRNMEVRTRKGITGNSFYSPKARTYYSPGREVY